MVIGFAQGVGHQLPMCEAKAPHHSWGL